MASLGNIQQNFVEYGPRLSRSQLKGYGHLNHLDEGFQCSTTATKKQSTTKPGLKTRLRPYELLLSPAASE